MPPPQPSPASAGGSRPKSPLVAIPSRQSEARATALPLRRVEHQLARRLAGFDQPVRLGGARQRQNPFDLRPDLALRGGDKAFRHVWRVIAGPALDGDALVVEVR